MIIKTNRRSSIIAILTILLFMPAYFGLFSPFVEATYQNIPLWGNVVLVVFLITVGVLAIKSITYSLEITDSGITQKTIGSWNLSWQEIQSWGYSLDSDGNYLFLRLNSNIDKEVLSCFLDKEHFLSIKTELEKRLGKPIQSS